MNESRLASQIRWRRRPATALRGLTAAADATLATPGTFELDPPLSLLDEAIFLLHTVAEVEHSLMVQYLYAAYSVKPEYADCQSKLRGTATEEMGHLMTVQNLLLGLGGPLNFDREDFPYRTGLYPFPFSLEPAALASIAKYVMAEKPLRTNPAELPPELEAEIRDKAKMDAGMEVDRVGMLLGRLKEVLTKLPESAFHPDPDEYQAGPAQWGSSAQVTRDTAGNITGVSSGVLVMNARNKQEALDAITAIALQGEGGEGGADAPDAHFRRFLELYKIVRDIPGSIAFPVPHDPSTTAETGGSAITFGPSRKLAQLGNHRYRFLLAGIAHSLTIQASGSGRGVLTNWCFEEMIGHIGPVSRLLAGMPRQRDPVVVAGFPFELPYTMSLPSNESARWRLLGAILEESAERIAAIRADEDLPSLAAPLASDLKYLLSSIETTDAARGPEIASRAA